MSVRFVKKNLKQKINFLIIPLNIKIKFSLFFCDKSFYTSNQSDKHNTLDDNEKKKIQKSVFMAYKPIGSVRPGMYGLTKLQKKLK